MRQKRVELDVEPAGIQAEGLHAAGNADGIQHRPLRIPARAGRGLFAQAAQLQRRRLELIRGLLQGLLQLLRRHDAAVCERDQAAGFRESVADQLLQARHIPLHIFAHVSYSRFRIRRSVEDVVMASYSFCVAWNAIGTWLYPMHSSPSPRRKRVICRTSSSERLSTP